MADNDETVGKADLITSSQVPSPEWPNDKAKDPFATGATWGPIPRMTGGMTFRELGQSGLRQFSGWVREEFLPQLVGRQGAQKYREMKDNSPVIGAILFAINATMRKVEWRTVPADDSPQAAEAAEFVEGCMADMSEPWTDLIYNNLTMLPFGFAPHEIVYKFRNGNDPGVDPDSSTGQDLPSSQFGDGKIGWRRMPLRSQDTVLKWFFDGNGQTMGLTQQPWIGPLIDIPIEKLLLFRASPFKNSPEGISILRNSYVSYYFSKRLQEQEAILVERFGGIPVFSIPAALMEAAAKGDGPAAAALAAFKNIATNVRIDEQMGIVKPSDTWVDNTGKPTNVEQYKFELVSPTMGRNGLDIDKIVTRYTVSMMTSVLADFLQLGHESRGTQSLAVSKVDMFFQAVEGFLNGMAGVYNRYAIPRLWKLNGMDLKVMPTIEPDLAQRVDLDVLSNFVLRLSQAGMPMFPNEDLQTYILDAGGLPDVSDPRALQASGLLDDQLDVQDAKDQAALDRMQNPPEAQPAAPGAKPGNGSQPGAKPAGSPTGANTPLEKMILAGVARRLIRNAGPRFDISTRKRVADSPLKKILAARKPHSHGTRPRA